MFGYIRPAYGELRVREHELYRAAYCGLCRSMGKCTGCLSRMTLNYDFVFLALVRSALTGETVQVESGRCIAHPLKRRPYMADSPSLRYSARMAAVLTYDKLRDDLADERGLRRILAAMAMPFAGSAAKRAGCGGIGETVAGELAALSELERRGSDDIDAAADCFGRLLSAVMAGELDGSPARIASEIGRYTGRFIYIADAADDMAEDAKRGRYNPILAAYGDSVLEERDVGDHRGGTHRRTVPKREIAEGILTAARLDLRRLEAAESLIDYGDGRQLRGIIGNMIGMGMPGELMRVLGLVPPGSAAHNVTEQSF